MIYEVRFEVYLVLINLLRLLLAAEALVLFLDKKNQKSSHLPMLLLPHEAIALQSQAAPRAVYILPLARLPLSSFIRQNLKGPSNRTSHPLLPAFARSWKETKPLPPWGRFKNHSDDAWIYQVATISGLRRYLLCRS
jgi:hypothetical protein